MSHPSSPPGATVRGDGGSYASAHRIAVPAPRSGLADRVSASPHPATGLPDGYHSAWEDDRLVRDLHDLTITRLSELAFELGAVSSLVQGVAEERITTAIEHIDNLIGEVRELLLTRQVRSAGPSRLVPAVAALVESAGPRMGCVPRLELDGDLDEVPPLVAGHVRAVVAEAVHNVVQHSRAATLDVQISLRDGHVAVSVADDGNGPPEPPVHGLGLGIMAARARELGGTFLFAPGPSSGTVVRWRVPLPASSSLPWTEEDPPCPS